MPTPYKGRAEIKCNAEICIMDKSRENVSPDCLECEAATATVVDLDARPLGEIKKKSASSAKPKKEVKDNGV